MQTKSIEAQKPKGKKNIEVEVEYEKSINKKHSTKNNKYDKMFHRWKV